jgi:hypothetical protein
VPLPFVHMEAPLYLRGGARRGPTLRESILVHAVARLALFPHVRNVQVRAALPCGDAAAGMAHPSEMQPGRACGLPHPPSPVLPLEGSQAWEDVCV